VKSVWAGRISPEKAIEAVVDLHARRSLGP
jgi:hypothetical protein